MVIVVDGQEYQGLQMIAGDLRVAATGVGDRLLIVSIIDWDGPLGLITVTPTSCPASVAPTGNK